MSGWKTVKQGNIELVHLSTSSLIKIVAIDEDYREDLIIDYYQFEELKKAINQLEGLQ